MDEVLEPDFLLAPGSGWRLRAPAGGLRPPPSLAPSCLRALAGSGRLSQAAVRAPLGASARRLPGLRAALDQRPFAWPAGLDVDGRALRSLLRGQRRLIISQLRREKNLSDNIRGEHLPLRE